MAEGYNGAFTGAQIDEAIGSVRNKTLPADGVKFSDGESFQQKYDAGQLTGPQGAQGEQGPQGDGQDQDQDQGGDQLHHQRHHGALVAGHPQNAAVGEGQRHIQGPGGQGVGVALGLPYLAGEGLLDLLPLQVVLHGAGVGPGVVEDAAVAGDPGDAVLGVEAGEVVRPLQLHAPGGQGRLHLQLVEDPGGVVAQQNRAKQRRAQQDDGDPHRQDGAENLFRHGVPPIL